MHAWVVLEHARRDVGAGAGWSQSKGEQRAPPMGGMEGPRGLCSGAGRVGSSVGSVGDALLLWSGPHRRAAEVALLAPLGGARRSREWSAWATTGAAVWGQATLPPRPTWGVVGHNSVLTRGRPSGCRDPKERSPRGTGRNPARLPHSRNILPDVITPRLHQAPGSGEGLWEKCLHGRSFTRSAWRSACPASATCS